ncbi:TOMM precursor leader peptide-binding protein [Streptomyces sp. NPDC020379]|uniref:TOMM precursor leader peptide-binding protein n=1 Tax=Streptomyces sp. NPDC020379 TaxID=3365071 RepID=UPI0037B0C495
MTAGEPLTPDATTTTAPADLGALAETRPRIRHDVLFTQTSEGVLFHNATGGFHLRSASAYRFASLIVPCLDGTHRVRELYAGLPEDRRSMVTELVRTLLDRGFARDATEPDGAGHPLPDTVAERFAQQIAYVDHFTGGAQERFARFRDTRVAVLGRDRVARWCALSTVRNGGAHVAVQGPDTAAGEPARGEGASPGAHPETGTRRAEEAQEEQARRAPGTGGPDDGLGTVLAEAEQHTAHGAPADVTLLPHTDTPLGWDDLAAYDVVVCAGSGAPRQLAHLLEEGVPQGRALLPVTVLADRVVAGPLMTAGRAGCWACAMLRLEANAEDSSVSAVWRDAGLPGPPAPTAGPGPGLAAMMGNLLGYDIFRRSTGALPAETDGHVVVQLLDSMDTYSETLLPHPGCPYCGPGDGLPGHVEPRQAEPAPEEPGSGAPGAGEPPAGPFTAGAPLTEPAPVVTPGTADEADRLLAELHERDILLGPFAGVFHAYDDDALTQIPLKASTVVLGTGDGRRRAVSAFDVHHVAGARLRALRTAAAVYAEHVAPLPGVLTACATTHPAPPLTEPGRITTARGLPAPPAAVHDWVAAVSLLTGERSFVPAAAVRTFGPYNTAGLYVPTTAGTGTGTSVPEAAYDGLMSALAYEALDEAVRGTRQATRVPLTPTGDPADPEVTFLVRTAENLGADVELLDLSDPDPAPGAPCVLLARAAGSSWAIGSDVSWRRAAVTALRDLLGRLQLEQDPEHHGPTDTGDPLMPDLAPDTLPADGDRPPAERGRAGDLLERLRAAGRDVLVVDTTSPDLRAGGLHVVRALLTRERTP